MREGHKGMAVVLPTRRHKYPIDMESLRQVKVRHGFTSPLSSFHSLLSEPAVRWRKKTKAGLCCQGFLLATCHPYPFCSCAGRVPPSLPMNSCLPAPSESSGPRWGHWEEADTTTGSGIPLSFRNKCKCVTLLTVEGNSHIGLSLRF